MCQALWLLHFHSNAWRLLAPFAGSVSAVLLILCKVNSSFLLQPESESDRCPATAQPITLDTSSARSDCRPPLAWAPAEALIGIEDENQGPAPLPSSLSEL